MNLTERERRMAVRRKAKKYPTSPAAKAKIVQTMREWKAGKLHSGSKKGPIIRSQKQAVAVALSKARKAVAGRKRSKKK